MPSGGNLLLFGSHYVSASVQIDSTLTNLLIFSHAMEDSVLQRDRQARHCSVASWHSRHVCTDYRTDAGIWPPSGNALYPSTGSRVIRDPCQRQRRHWPSV